MASQPVTDVVSRFTSGGLWVAVGVMFTWHVLVSLPFVVLVWARYGLAASGLLIWAGFTLAGTVSAIAVLRGGWRRPALPWTVCGLLIAGMLGNVLTMHGGFFGANQFGFTADGWFALVALWNRTLGELLGFFAVNDVAGLAGLLLVHQADRAHLAMFIIDCLGSSVLQVTIYIGIRTVASVAGRAAEAEDATARARNARLAAEAVQAQRRARYEEVSATVTPLLEGIADGTLDLAAPRARQRIAIAVTRLRRLLAETDEVPDPLSHELRAIADAAERRGVAVDLIAPAGVIPLLGVAARRALTEPVIAALAAARTRARITVIAAPGRVTVAIVADVIAADAVAEGPTVAGAPLPDQAQVSGWPGRPDLTADGEVRCEWAEEGNRLWAQAEWTRSSASLS